MQIIPIHSPSGKRVLSERYTQSCRIRYLGKRSPTVLIEFEDGVMVATNLRSLRKASRKHQKGNL